MHTRHLTRIAVVSSAAALALSACSGDKKDAEPAAPGTSTSSGTASSAGTASGKDESATVLAYAAPKATASATGTWDSGSSQVKVVLSAAEVRTSAASSRLTYTVAGTGTHQQVQAYTSSWTDFPTIVDTTGKKRYAPNTYERQGDSGPERHCVCTEQIMVENGRPTTVTVQFPPLPASVKEVEVQQKGFAPLKVAVTR